MKKQATKRAYIKPESKVYPMAVESLLDAASGNAGTIGYGGDAKKHNGDWDDWDDEEEETSAGPTSSLFNE